MVKLMNSFLVISLALVFSCKNSNSLEPTAKADGKLQLSLTKESLGKGLGKILSGNITNVVIDIETETGQPVYSSKVVHLLNMDGEYISEPLSLEEGNYKLTKFLVTDAADTVVYAAPLRNSTLAYLVNNPLEISFSLNANETKKLVPEVLATEERTPEEFGLLTFSFNVVETIDFLINTLIYNNTTKNFEQTTANISVLGDSTEIYSGVLLAETNKIVVNKGYTSYRIIVAKNGYINYSDQFTSIQLESFFDNPLKVILNPTQ